MQAKHPRLWAFNREVFVWFFSNAKVFKSLLLFTKSLARINSSSFSKSTQSMQNAISEAAFLFISSFSKQTDTPFDVKKCSISLKSFEFAVFIKTFFIPLLE